MEGCVGDEVERRMEGCVGDEVQRRMEGCVGDEVQRRMEGCVGDEVEARHRPLEGLEQHVEGVVDQRQHRAVGRRLVGHLVRAHGHADGTVQPRALGMEVDARHPLESAQAEGELRVGVPPQPVWCAPYLPAPLQGTLCLTLP